jgi:hypothetical protein
MKSMKTVAAPALLAAALLVVVAGPLGCGENTGTGAAPGASGNTAAGPGAKQEASGGDGLSAARTISNRLVDAACGVCIYKMPGITGCPLAIKIDGRPYLVEGATWPNHDYCERDCRAIVSGKLEGDPLRFIATSLEPKQ